MFGNTRIPEITKNLLIINAIVCLALNIIPVLQLYLPLSYFSNDLFRPWQLATHMFSHVQFWHLFFNMFSLWMFGSILEQVLGPKRFLAYYLITGFGGAFLYMLVNVLQVYAISGNVWLTPENISALQGHVSYENLETLRNIFMTKMLGASGAVFGILIGFAFFFPDTQLMLIFPPIPVRAKVLVAILIIYELIMGYQQQGNIAHFAHLGGALFGYFILKSWRRRGIL